MAIMKLIFVGTGVSCGIPVIGHLNKGDACACQHATRNAQSRNRRNNVSLMVLAPKNKLRTPTDTSTIRDNSSKAQDVIDGQKAASSSSCCYSQHSMMDQDNALVLIDCGKTFRDAYFRILAPRGIRYVDALLLTHGHADAMQCVGELCTLQTEARKRLMNDGHDRHIATSCFERIPTFLTAPTAREVAVAAPEVMPHSYTMVDGKEERVTPEPQACSQHSDEPHPVGLQMHHVSESHPMLLSIDALAPGIPMYSVPVEHGKGYISLGFVFGTGTAFKSAGATRTDVEGKSCIAYISDISSIPEASMAFLLDLVKIDVLVFDLLAEKGVKSPPHTCWDDIMPYIRALTPRRTLCVGMFCSLEHEASNALWIKDLAEEKQRCVASVEKNKKKGGHDDDDDGGVERRQDEAFLEVVESIELAYDGMELEVPL